MFETEAKSKWCPFSKSDNGLCIGSGCMAWRTENRYDGIYKALCKILERPFDYCLSDKASRCLMSFINSDEVITVRTFAELKTELMRTPNVGKVSVKSITFAYQKFLEENTVLPELHGYCGLAGKI